MFLIFSGMELFCLVLLEMSGSHAPSCDPQKELESLHFVVFPAYKTLF